MTDNVELGPDFSTRTSVLSCQPSFHQLSIHIYHQGLVQLVQKYCSTEGLNVISLLEIDRPIRKAMKIALIMINPDTASQYLGIKRY
jgi:hypothetical protein